MAALPCAENFAGSFEVTGAAKCGSCYQVPFAYDRNNDTDCWAGGNAASRTLCNPAAVGLPRYWTSSPFKVSDPNTGAEVTIHCVGPQIVGGGPQLPADTRSFVPNDYGAQPGAFAVTNSMDECLLSQEALAVWGRQVLTNAPWSFPFDQRAWCTSNVAPQSRGMAQCDFDTPARHSETYNWDLEAVVRPPTLAGFFCEKPVPSTNPSICVDAADGVARLREGGRLLNVLTTMYGGRGRAGALPLASPPDVRPSHGLPRYCFIDKGSVRHLPTRSAPFCARPCAVEPGPPGLQPHRDPGLLISGVPLVLSNTSTIELYSNNLLVATTPIEGAAAANFTATGAILSDLEIRQTNSVTALGHTIQNAYGNISNYWFGTINSTGNMSIPTGGARLFVRYDDNGVVFDQVITSTAVATGTRAGGQTTLNAEFVDGAIKVVLHLVMVDSAVRPSATITSAVDALTNLPIGGTDLQCHRDTQLGAGINVHATGVVANGTAAWQANGPRLLSGFLGEAASADAFLPLGLPTDRASTITLSAWSGGMLAQALRSVRAIDTVAPSITLTVLEPPCGWGRLQVGNYVVNTDLCAPITGNFADACDDHPIAEMISAKIFEWPSGVLLEERNLVGKNCLRVYPPALNGALANVDYEVEYRAHDAWGNWSPVRRWRGYFSPASSNGTCGAPAIPITISDQ